MASSAEEAVRISTSPNLEYDIAIRTLELELYTPHLDPLAQVVLMNRILKLISNKHFTTVKASATK